MLPHFANLLFSVAVKPAASFSAIALLGSFICWQLRPLASTSPSKPPQLIRRETGAPAICFFFSLPTILLSRTFPLSELRYQSPGSSDFRNWLGATPAAFTASSSKIPSLTAMSGEQLYGSTRKWFCSTQQFYKSRPVEICGWRMIQ